MLVHLGNADAIEAVKNEDGSTVFQSLPGERVTTFVLDDGLTIMEKFQTVLAGLTQMMNPTARPWWVECDDPALGELLLSHFGMPDDRSSRPPAWGDGTTTAPKEKDD